MFPDVSGFMRMKAEAAKAERVTVTTEEFIKLMIAEGRSEEKAKSQAMFAKALGSETLIGGRMVGISDPT